MRLLGGVLNIHDRGAGPAANRIDLRRVAIANRGFFVGLNDRKDKLHIKRSKLTTYRGVSVRVAGMRDDHNAGGTVLIKDSMIRASDADAVVSIVASEHSGRVHMSNSVVDTDGLLTVLAHNCMLRRGRRTLNCSTDASLSGLAD